VGAAQIQAEKAAGRHIPLPGLHRAKKIRHEDFVFAAACGVHLVRNSGPRYLNMPIKTRMSGRDTLNSAAAF
jgi:hypothetical protein